MSRPNSAAEPTARPASTPERIIQVAVLGLGGSGKSSIINMLQGDFDTKLRPTNGFRPVTMMLDAATQIRFYDLGGGDKIRSIWDQYYHDVHAIIYVVDASANDAVMEKASEVYRATLGHSYLNGKPLLVLANKQDQTGAKSAKDIEAAIGISGQHEVKIAVCCGIPQDGIDPATVEDPATLIDNRIENGIEWLLGSVNRRFEELNGRVVRDTQEKQKLEARKRMERERKVLRNKIACAFPAQIPADLKPPNTPEEPEDVFTIEEGLAFLAAEVGEDVGGLSVEAHTVVVGVGAQRLALQLVGALYAPINKKKIPMSWQEILLLIDELRAELGLQAVKSR